MCLFRDRGGGEGKRKEGYEVRGKEYTCVCFYVCIWGGGG